MLSSTILVVLLLIIAFKYIYHSKKEFDFKFVFISLLVFSSGLFTLTIYEGNELYSALNHFPNTSEFSISHITLDELAVIEYLNNEGVSGIVLTSSVILSRRIGGIGFLPTIPGYHMAQQLYYEWLNATEVTFDAMFDLSFFIENLQLKSSILSYERELLNVIRALTVSSTSNYTKLVYLSIQYVVAFRKELNSTVPYQYIDNSFEIIQVPILETLSLIEPSYSTKYLLVWKLF